MNRVEDFESFISVLEMKKSLIWIRNLYYGKLKFKTFEQAFIGGKLFKSRGMAYQEDVFPIRESRYGEQQSEKHGKYLPQNKENRLCRSILRNKNAKDAFCKFQYSTRLSSRTGDIMSRDYKINLEKQFTIQFGTELKPFMTDYLAVINGFFRIDESVNEPFLAGVPFAAVTCWEITPHPHARILLLDNEDKNSFFPGIQFIPIRSIIPSRIALSLMDSSYSPISFSDVSQASWTVIHEMNRPRRKIMESLHLRNGLLYSLDEDEMQVEHDEL